MKEISSIQRRFFAYLIDSMILFIPAIVIAFLLINFPLILHLSYLCLNCSYFTYFISTDAQATPGQRLMNICTVKIDYSKIDLNLAFDRSISQFFLTSLNSLVVNLISFFGAQGVLASILNILAVSIVLLTFSWYFVACLSKKKQTFHDMLFDTVVVKSAFK